MTRDPDDMLRECRLRAEQLRLDEVRRRGGEAERRRGSDQTSMARARNERLHAERHRHEEARRRRVPPSVRVSAREGTMR